MPGVPLVPLISTRTPVGPPPLVTTKSNVFVPLTNPLLIANGVKLWKPGVLLFGTSMPFSLMMPELSAAHWPVSITVPGGTNKTDADGGPVKVEGATAIAVDTGKKIMGKPAGTPQ